MAVRARRRHRHRALIGIAALATTLAATLGALSGPIPAVHASVHTGEGPNILLILTDDLDRRSVARMPILQATMVAQGVRFDDYFVNVPLCCPSRATTLRGQYAHNTGIEGNSGVNGGFATAFATGIESSTVGTWLQAAGYRTALIGKYLNGYPAPAGVTYVPPGWTEWDSAVMGEPYTQYDYTLNQNGALVSYGRDRSDYGTSVYLRVTKHFVTRAAQAHQPFFVFLSLYAPHAPSRPAPQDVGAFRGATAPRSPNYNEADVRDKPAWIRSRPRFTAEQIAGIDAAYRQRIRSLQAVDRAVGDLVSTLRDNGQLANTYIVFTSDNGFHLGSHRLRLGKQTEYDEDLNVPLIVRGPGIPANSTRHHLTGNVDLAPTFAELAGATTPEFVDGRSLAPLLRAEPPPVASWRSVYLLEHFNTVGATLDGTGPQEPPDADEQRVAGQAFPSVIPDFRGLRSLRYAYIELATGERELYDHTTDPFELHNIASHAPPELLADLHTRLAALALCRADSCRTADR